MACEFVITLPALNQHLLIATLEWFMWCEVNGPTVATKALFIKNNHEFAMPNLLQTESAMKNYYPL